MDYLKCKYPFIVLVTDNIIKNYKSKQSVPKINNVKSISIKCDRIYHITYGYEILL